MMDLSEGNLTCEGWSAWAAGGGIMDRFWVLFNGEVFWVSAGVWSSQLGDACRLSEADVEQYFVEPIAAALAKYGPDAYSANKLCAPEFVPYRVEVRLCPAGDTDRTFNEKGLM